MRFLFRKRSRFSILDLWDIWQGLVGAVAVLLAVYFVGGEMVGDRTARMVLLATVAAIAAVGGLGLLWRRYRARRPR